MKNLLRYWLFSAGVEHLIQNARHFIETRQRSPEDRYLLAQSRTLQDRHKGQRCFVLGAGPSIAEQDLSKLCGEAIISVSNTFVHPLYRDFHPLYHAVPPMLLSHGRYYDQQRFVTWLTAMEEGTGQAEMIFHIEDRGMIENNGLFQNRIIHWVDYVHWNGSFRHPLSLERIPNIWSVSELAVTLAVYLGFDPIYLLGFDHDWFNGVLNYFYDHRKDHKLQPDQANLNHVDAELQMRRHAEIFRKYKYLSSKKASIFNANSNKKHYLDVFPKADFYSLF